MGVNVRNDHGTAITFLRERVHNAATNSIIAGKLPAWEMLLKEEHDSRGRHWRHGQIERRSVIGVPQIKDLLLRFQPHLVEGQSLASPVE